MKTELLDNEMETLQETLNAMPVDDELYPQVIADIEKLHKIKSDIESKNDLREDNKIKNELERESIKQKRIDSRNGVIKSVVAAGVSLVALVLTLGAEDFKPISKNGMDIAKRMFPNGK